MTQDNKKRLIHLNGHFQAIAAMEMVDKAAFRKKMIGKWPINPSLVEIAGKCYLCQISELGFIESCGGKGIGIIRRDLNDLKA